MIWERGAVGMGEGSLLRGAAGSGGEASRAPASRRSHFSAPSLKRPGFRAFAPLRHLGMLVVSTRLGSGKARAALTFILFLVIWLLLSIPDAFGKRPGNYAA